MTNDLHYFAQFTRFKEPRDDKIGFYSFHESAFNDDPAFPPDYEAVMTFGAYVIQRDNRVILDPWHGDPPPAKAGRALDLHCAIVARVRGNIETGELHRFYFIDDAGRIAEVDVTGLDARMMALAAVELRRPRARALAPAPGL